LRCVFAIVLIAAAGVSACHRADSAPPIQELRLATGAPGGGFYPLGERLASTFARAMPNLRVEVHTSGGAVSNVEAIQRGDADVGLTFADVAYVAFVGQLDSTSHAFDRLRGVAALELTPVHLVVSGRSHIVSVRDLRGRRVSVGPPGSGTALTAGLVLQAFGIGPGDVRTEALPFNEAERRLEAGALDAMFDNAIYPADSVANATRLGARLIPITGPHVDALRREYPFFRLAFIPPNTYRRAPDAIHTIGVESLLVCRSDLDEATVYALTKRFFEALPSLSSSQNALRFIDLEQAPATPIPLHEGAARYYRERELLR
jgi:TRAP transporter TAXI family solute receptor